MHKFSYRCLFYNFFVPEPVHFRNISLQKKKSLYVSKQSDTIHLGRRYVMKSVGFYCRNTNMLLIISF